VPPEPPFATERGDGVSRRAFIKGASLTVAAVGVAGPGASIARGARLDAPEVPILGPGPVPMTLRVNGVERALETPPSTTLLDALRDSLGLTGAKRVCDRGSCGACTVLLDGRVVDSCSMLAIDAVGREVTTVEGCGTPENPSALQSAFVECDALQCGFCTPGMVVTTTALVRAVPRPSREQVAQAISGNICRCGTYQNIFEAVERATRGGGPGGR
jgi:aerobic-type carbon monoxide dehydrogenase small subunit (CoxS/CutS family)